MINVSSGSLAVGALDIDTGKFHQIGGHEASHSRALVLLRHHGWPVGIEVLPLTEGSIGPLDRELLDEVPETLSQLAPAAGPISLVICTRDRPHLLERALTHFVALDGGPHDIIVVDNAPSDSRTAKVVATFGDRVRYVVEPTPGLARARNCGLGAAAHEFVAFTDDDVVPDPSWLRVIAATFNAHPGSVCVSGSVLPASLSTPAELLFQEFGGYFHDFAETQYHLSLDPRPSVLFPFHPRLLGTGANMAFRTEALRAIGGFDPVLGAGTPSRGGEDIDVAVRLLTAGHLLVRQPSAVLWHPSHTTEEALTRQIEDYGCGLAAVFTKFMHERKLAPALLRRVPAGISAMFSSSSSKNAQRSGTYPKHLRRAELKGMAKGPAAYRRSRRHHRKHRAESA